MRKMGAMCNSVGNAFYFKHQSDIFDKNDIYITLTGEACNT